MGKFDPATMTERERHLYNVGLESFAAWVGARHQLTTWRTLFYIALLGNVVQWVVSVL